MNGYSLSWLQREREELRRDRAAFASALDILSRRILESNDVDVPRRPLLHEWSGSRACVGSLEMSLHAIERTIEGVEEMIMAINNGEAVDTDISAPQAQAPGGSN